LHVLPGFEIYLCGFQQFKGNTFDIIGVVNNLSYFSLVFPDVENSFGNIDFHICLDFYLTGKAHTVFLFLSSQ